MSDASSRTHSDLSSALSAALWMGGALLSFVVLAVAGREASKSLDTFAIMLLRSIIGGGIVVAIAMVLPNGMSRLKTYNIRLQLLRNGAHFVGQYCWFLALTLIPLAQVFALEFTTPIWVALLAPFLVNEKLTRIRLATAMIGFVGVMVVVRPGATEVNVGTIVMLVGALGFALSMIAVKRLVRSDDPLAILFWMSVLQAPIALVPAVWSFAWPPLVAWGWMVVITLMALSAHFCMARAFRLADAIVVAPMDFFRLPLIAVVAAALYGEPFDFWVVVGGAIIVAANLLNISAEGRRGKVVRRDK